MRYVRTSFDRADGRRDRRYPLPPLTITVDGADYVTLNWSLGGFLIGGWARCLRAGDLVEGILRAEANGRDFSFAAEVVRFDAEAATLAVKIATIAPEAIDHLDRALARRFARRRPA